MMGLDGGRRLLGDQETIKAQSPRTTLRRLGAYLRRYLLVLVVVAVLIVASTWAQVLAPSLIGQAVDCYVAVTPQSTTSCWFTADPAPSVAGLGRITLAIALLYVLSAAVGGATFFLMSWVGQHVLLKLRQEIFVQIHRLPLGYYTVHEAGDIMSRLTNDVDTIQQAMSFGLVQVSSGVLLIGWIATRMFRDNAAYATLSLAVLPFMLVTTSMLSGRARRAFRKSRQEMGSVNAGLQESIAGVREVQAFAREDENIEVFRRTNEANRRANVLAVRYTSALAPTLEFLSYISIAVVVGVGGIWALRGTPVFGTVFTLGLVITFLGYTQRLNMPVQQISMLWTNLQNAVAGSERIFAFLDEVPSLRDAPGAQPLPPIAGRVTFDGVWAEYVPGQPVLRGVDIVAEPGQTIAIVGPTGAGKTTIINLLPRFWDVTQGAVTIDGHDVRDVTQDSLHRQIGIVLQDTFLFSDTVLNNIRYGRPDATDEEVIQAARLVQADGFVERLPEGFHTVLGERGGGLSQGQRQLIAIARAALANPRILILDEATSSVDTRTERLIQAALETIMGGRTTFVIAHRLSTVRHADIVLVVDEGQIVERGTHDELMARRGAYHALVVSQLAGAPDAAQEQAQVAAAGDGRLQPVAYVAPPRVAHTDGAPMDSVDAATVRTALPAGAAAVVTATAGSPRAGHSTTTVIAAALVSALLTAGIVLFGVAMVNGGSLHYDRSATAPAAAPASTDPMENPTPRPTATLRISHP